MNSQEIKTKGFALIEEAINVIEEASKTPIQLFNDDIDCDNIDEYPYAYYVTKHNMYLTGNIMKLIDGKAEIFMNGEEWGEIYSIPINEIPVESLFLLMDYI